MTPTLRRNFSSPMLSLSTCWGVRFIPKRSTRCFVHLGQLNRRCSAVSPPSRQLGQIGESSFFISHLVFASTRLLPILSCSMRRDSFLVSFPCSSRLGFQFVVLRYQFNVDEGLSAARWCTSIPLCSGDGLCFRLLPGVLWLISGLLGWLPWRFRQLSRFLLGMHPVPRQ